MTEEPQPGPSPIPATSPAGRPPRGQPRWRLVLGDGAAPDPRPGADNMATDQALLDAVAAGADPVVRLYRWAPATLSFGRNQPARDLYDEATAAERGIAFVRRPTGGQAVLHDDELTYAVVAPIAILGKPRAAYRWINEALVAGLRALGVDAEAAAAAGDGDVGYGHGLGLGQGQGDGGREWLEACFRRPARGEVVARGRKLVGSAQRTHSRTILQHGSILLGGTQAPAEELLLADTAARSSGSGPRSRPRPGSRAPQARGPLAHGGRPDPGWTTVEAELGRRPSLDALVEAVVSGFEDVVGISLARSTLTPEEGAEAAALRGRFESPAWTWRR